MREAWHELSSTLPLRSGEAEALCRARKCRGGARRNAEAWIKLALAAAAALFDERAVGFSDASIGAQRTTRRTMP